MYRGLSRCYYLKYYGFCHFIAGILAYQLYIFMIDLVNFMAPANTVILYQLYFIVKF